MDDYKIPRKLKKRLKKLHLASFSESYKRHRNLKSKKLRVLYINKQRGVFGIGVHKH